ncbi:MAG: hypothetical protein JNM44_10140 [Chitinophagaceae bacterium]|nr:hypothetical protein [Chitinophagaceae bacterium]
MSNFLKLASATGLVVLVLFAMVLLPACNKDVKYNDTTLVRPCDNVICLNGGACLDGQCQCTKGFEGTNCGIRWSDKFLGSYQASDDCQNGVFYNVQIFSHPEFAWKMRIQNLGKFCINSTLTAEINPEKTSFIIPMQNTCGSYYLSGYGNISSNYINIYLKNRDSVMHTGEQCSIILNKL